MIQYKCVKIRERVEDIQSMLNELAMDGWKVICSYAFDNNYLILEKGGLNGKERRN